MKQWLLSVAGIAVLSVLADIILPVGQTKKYIKTVVGIAVTLATVEPLLSIFSTKSLETTVESSVISAQQNYLDYVEQSRSDRALTVQEALRSVGFSNAEVVFDADARRLVAQMHAKYSQTALETAQIAATSAESLYSVVFVWNDG